LHSNASEEIRIHKKIRGHLDKQEAKAEIQNILLEFMHEDYSSLALLKNNAKLLGGVIGAETKFLD